MPGRAALADVRRDEKRDSGTHAIALLHQLLSSGVPRKPCALSQLSQSDGGRRATE